MGNIKIIALVLTVFSTANLRAGESVFQSFVTRASSAHKSPTDQSNCDFRLSVLIGPDLDLGPDLNPSEKKNVIYWKNKSSLCEVHEAYIVKRLLVEKSELLSNNRCGAPVYVGEQRVITDGKLVTTKITVSDFTGPNVLRTCSERGRYLFEESFSMSNPDSPDVIERSSVSSTYLKD